MKIDFYGHEFDTNIPIIVGRDLKLMRLQAKITTSIAAEYMGIKSRKTIENWESDSSSPSIQQLMLLCRYYDFHSWKVIAQCMDRSRTHNPLENYQDIDLDACR